MKKLVKTISIRGINVDLEKITNPKLRKITHERSFLFFYTDNKGSFNQRTGNYEDSNYDDRHLNYSARHSDFGHTDAPNHTDKENRTYGDYSERSGHSDYRHTSEETRKDHTDTTKHADSHTDEQVSTYDDAIY